MTAKQIQDELEACANPAKREVLVRFFKTGPGEYGEGDRFLGVMVPDTRRVAKRWREASDEVLADLLASPWHECRLCALLVWVEQFRNGTEADRRHIYRQYLAHTPSINNWDLVDLSAPSIVGAYLADKSRDDLYRLADEGGLWEQRIAVVATLTLIRQGCLDDTFALAERLMDHRHDLMHKAVGWMLREAGKRDTDRLLRFLDRYACSMPRTMLRYAIEKLPETQRKYYLLKKRERMEKGVPLPHIKE
ncbi:MAG: DNA alkylation repair protein [Bacteroidaceae bacterium]